MHQFLKSLNVFLVNTKYIHIYGVILNKTVTKLVTFLTKCFFYHVCWFLQATWRAWLRFSYAHDLVIRPITLSFRLIHFKPKHMVDHWQVDPQIWQHILERYLINRICLLLEVIQKLNIIQNYQKEVLLVWSLWLVDWGWWQLVFTTSLKETRKEGLFFTLSLWDCPGSSGEYNFLYVK